MIVATLSCAIVISPLNDTPNSYDYGTRVAGSKPVCVGEDLTGTRLQEGDRVGFDCAANRVTLYFADGRIRNVHYPYAGLLLQAPIWSEVCGEQALPWAIEEGHWWRPDPVPPDPDRVCPDCGQPIKGHRRECPQCHPVNTRNPALYATCPGCGGAMRRGSRVCAKCKAHGL